MSHYLIGVVLPFHYEGDKLTDAIGEILAPWDERDGDNENGRWDWWQLGGRWTGVWSDYDPAADPANREFCWLCDGTGLRNDALGQAHREQNPGYTCNGCGYGEHVTPGVKLKHATKWLKRSDLDVVPITRLLAMEDAQLPYAIAAAPDVWLERESWTGATFEQCPDWPAVVRAALDLRRECYVAAVDVHS